jgi:hypothetical protein
MRYALILPIALCGCATTLDPNYAMQIQAYADTVRAQQSVEVAKARAEEARYNAMASIASTADPQSKQMALLALALGGHGGEASAPRAVVLPNIPESQEDRALKWAAVFAGPVTSVATGYFGYRLGVTQSNNATQSTVASYNAFGSVAQAGFAANTGIATSGINATAGIANTAFATLPLIRPTLPSITLNGTGVINTGAGNSDYTGPNSGTNSGNTGRISSPNDDHHSVVCTPTATVPC